jgi:hypothetical protein
MKPPYEYQLRNAETRLDLWDALKDPKHSLNEAWPLFLDNDLSQQHFANTILQHSGLRKFQFAIVELDPAGGEAIIACGRSIPFFWPELEGVGDIGELTIYPDVLRSLPDGGYYCLSRHSAVLLSGRATSIVFTNLDEGSGRRCADLPDGEQA